MLTNKFIRIIKIENKTFEDLTLAEIALMIDADISISPHGNDYFSSSALDIFLHNTELKRKDLIEIQKKILDNIYFDIKNSKNKSINIDYLIKLSSELKLAK